MRNKKRTVKIALHFYPFARRSEGSSDKEPEKSVLTFQPHIHIWNNEKYTDTCSKDVITDQKIMNKLFKLDYRLRI